MAITVSSLDEQAYRALRGPRGSGGRTVGELISEAIRGYLGCGAVKRAGGEPANAAPEPFREGNERLSSEIDAIVYGVRR